MSSTPHIPHVQVLGMGCSRCRATLERIDSVAREADRPIRLDKVEDLRTMQGFGVTALPAVVVDGAVVHVGSVPGRSQVLAWLLRDSKAKPQGVSMTTLRVYDPALCCSTGVCGPTVDPDLARFAGDVEWLKGKGVSVERFNLAQQPGAFVEPAVKSALESLGEAALPLVQLGGATIATGHYPSRDVLAKLTGVPLEVESPHASATPKAGCC